MTEVASAALDGLLILFQPHVFMYLVAGIFAGMFFGLVPGLSGLTGLGLLMPFAFGQPPEVAFAFLLGMYSATTQTDTIPAVLIGVPGTAAAQATLLDGYPMAKNGEAGRALSASYAASIFGSMVAAGVFFAFLPVLRPIIDGFAAPEFYMLAMMGLIMAGSLAGTSMLRGLAMAGFGLLLSQVGFAPNTGFPRFNFGWDYLLDGLPLVPVVLGLFAVPEVIELLQKGSSIAGDSGAAHGGIVSGFRDNIRNKWLIVRCGLIGTVCGMVPGLGGTAAEWFAYGHAVQTAKDSSRFGKGDVRGVISPESATAGQKPGAILPTVAFGIPGNGAMAILLGVFLIVGLRPGPEMLNEKLSITAMMVWTVVAGNILAALLALMLQNQMIRLVRLRPTIIAPMILCFMLLGAGITTKTFADPFVFAGFGLLGYVLKRTDWPRVPLVIGLVLGFLSETYLFITVDRYGIAWLWQRPIVVVIVLLIVVSLALPLFRTVKARRAARSEAEADG